MSRIKFSNSCSKDWQCIPQKGIEYFTLNTADFGDVIYVVDESYFDVCSREPSNPHSSSGDCFIQVLSQISSVYEHDNNMTSIKFTLDNCSKINVLD